MRQKRAVLSLEACALRLCGELLSSRRTAVYSRERTPRLRERVPSEKKVTLALEDGVLSFSSRLLSQNKASL